MNKNINIIIIEETWMKYELFFYFEIPWWIIEMWGAWPDRQLRGEEWEGYLRSVSLHSSHGQQLVSVMSSVWPYHRRKKQNVRWHTTHTSLHTSHSAGPPLCHFPPRRGEARLPVAPVWEETAAQLVMEDQVLRPPPGQALLLHQHQRQAGGSHRPRKVHRLPGSAFIRPKES